MARPAILVRPLDRQPPLDVEGVDVSVLASGEEAHGPEFTVQSGGAGMGAPPHAHPWDEAFFILRGMATFTCDGVTEACAPGTFVFVPGGMIHSFSFGPTGCEMLDVTGAGSKALERFRAIATAHAAPTR